MYNEKEFEAEIDRMTQELARLSQEREELKNQVAILTDTVDKNNINITKLEDQLKCIHSMYNPLPKQTQYDRFAKLKAILVAKQLITEIENIGIEEDVRISQIRESVSKAEIAKANETNTK